MDHLLSGRTVTEKVSLRPVYETRGKIWEFLDDGTYLSDPRPFNQPLSWRPVNCWAGGMPLPNANLSAVTGSVHLPVSHHVHELVGWRTCDMQYMALIIEHPVEVRLLELTVIRQDVCNHVLVVLVPGVHGLVRLVDVGECSVVKVQCVLVILEELRELILRVVHVVQCLVVIAHVVVDYLLVWGGVDLHPVIICLRARTTCPGTGLGAGARHFNTACLYGLLACGQDATRGRVDLKSIRWWPTTRPQ
jgi:hypothetical protein